MDVRVISGTAAGDFDSTSVCASIQMLVEQGGGKEMCVSCGGECRVELNRGVGGVYAVAYVVVGCPTAKDLSDRVQLKREG